MHTIVHTRMHMSFSAYHMYAHIRVTNPLVTLMSVCISVCISVYLLQRVTLLFLPILCISGFLHVAIPDIICIGRRRRRHIQKEDMHIQCSLHVVFPDNHIHISVPAIYRVQVYSLCGVAEGGDPDALAREER